MARGLGAARVIAAVPVGAADAVALLARDADEVVCPLRPAAFGAVSAYYDSFPQTSDREVTALLR